MASAKIADAGPRASRASAVVVQRVPAAAVDGFLAWQRGATEAAEGFGGYCGTDVFPPADGRGDEWVVLIHFEDEESLARWLGSPERARRLEALRSEVGDFDLKTLRGGFGAWFVGQGRASASGAAPAPWKMALTVLLGLFPTVMLLTIFVGPWTSGLGLAASMLIGNALSVAALQWAVMPPLTAVLGPWLRADGAAKGAVRFAVPGLILLLLAALAIAFRQVTG